jgi:hypothetical protein
VHLVRTNGLFWRPDLRMSMWIWVSYERLLQALPRHSCVSGRLGGWCLVVLVVVWISSDLTLLVFWICI